MIVMREIKQLIESEVKAGKTPSVQYYLFTKDQLLKEFRCGVADVANQTAISDEHTYNAYSVTKTFTALAILQLAEQKKLYIGDSVSSYLPQFPYGSAVTIRQLLNHTAGIPNPIPLSWIHLKEEHGGFDAAAFFQNVIDKNKKLRTKPGERFSYSNLGYIFLGQIIEQLSDKRYEDFITESIIDKLRADSIELGFETKHDGHHAKGYHKPMSVSNLVLGLFINKKKYMSKAEGNWKPFKPFYVNGAPYGGLIGKPLAFVKYIQSLLQNDSALLSNQYKKLLFEESKTRNAIKTGMALSWFTGELNGHRFVTHAGGGGGFYCEIRLYTEQNLGSVVFFNRTGMTDERFLNKVDGVYLPRMK